MLKYIVILTVILTAHPVCAQERVASPAPVPQTNTRIVTDDEHGTVSIFVQGREVVRVDAGGMHVFGDISYTGAVTDGTPPRIEAKHD